MDKTLLSIIEIGGYANFTPLYKSKGFEVESASSMRKAIKVLKKSHPAVIVAEFNYQSDFRDRTSTLESLLATVERLQQSHSQTIKVIVFYEMEYQHQLEKLQAMFDNFEALSYPIQEQKLKECIAQSDASG